MKKPKHEEHLQTHELKKADKEHGAYRPRMNAIFEEHADKHSGHEEKEEY